MVDDDCVTIRELSHAVRHWEIALEGTVLARLTWEGTSSQCRLQFDGDVRQEVMRAVLEKVTREILTALPTGVCIVHRGHLVSSFAYGQAAG